MKYLLFSILTLSIFTVSSCTSDSAGGNSNKRLDYNYLGDAFCKCAQPTIELNQELKRLQKTDKQAFLSKIKEAGNKAKESIDCCKASMKNHTNALPDASDLKTALKKQCDGIPEQMLEEIVGVVTR